MKFPREETFLSTVGKFWHRVDQRASLGTAISLRPPMKRKGTPLMRSALSLVDGSVGGYRLTMRWSVVVPSASVTCRR